MIDDSKNELYEIDKELLCPLNFASKTHLTHPTTYLSALTGVQCSHYVRNWRKSLVCAPRPTRRLVRDHLNLHYLLLDDHTLSRVRAQGENGASHICSLRFNSHSLP